MSEQLWMLNAAMHKEWKYPHFADMIESAGERDVQRERDDLERQQVHEWLMGGDA